jgi:hypothetical protein
MINNPSPSIFIYPNPAGKELIIEGLLMALAQAEPSPSLLGLHSPQAPINQGPPTNREQQPIPKIHMMDIGTPTQPSN